MESVIKMNIFDYEADRLHEIYELLYPKSRILLVIQEVTAEIARPREISKNDFGEIERYRKNGTRIIEIGKQCEKVPSRAFIIQIPIDNAAFYSGTSSEVSPSRQIAKFSVNLLATILARLAPLFYEYAKYRYHRLREAGVIKLLKLSNPRASELLSRDSKGGALIAMHWLDVGGAELFAAQCCDLLDTLHQETIIVVAHLSRRFYLEVLASKHKIYELERQVPKGEEGRFLLGLVYKHNIQTIHNHHNAYVYESLPLIAQITRRPCVIDSLHIDEKKRYRYGYVRYAIMYSEFIDYHHVISSRLVDILVRQDISSNKIIFGHLAPSTLREQLFFCNQKTAGAISLCFIGRMTKQKRPILALSLLFWAARYCENHGINYKATIVGDGPYLKLVSSIIKRSRYRRLFLSLPANADVASVLSESDILLITSENEGISLTGYDAITKGCIVISTDVGAQRELIPDLLLLPENPVAAYRIWKRVFVALMNDRDFQDNAIKHLLERVQILIAKPSAEAAIQKIYLRS